MELRILKRYLLAALGLLSVGILLTIMDERWSVAHVTAATAVLMLGVVGISMVAIYRSRAIVDGLIRTTTPSVRDALTGLPDEQYFRLRLREECKRVGRYGIPVSLAIIDVNNLASVNEAYGEACGDAVLGHIASILESTKRASDIAARLSDDEFALILLECARPDASRYVHRLEQYVARRPGDGERRGAADNSMDRRVHRPGVSRRREYEPGGAAGPGAPGPPGRQRGAGPTAGTLDKQPRIALPYQTTPAESRRPPRRGPVLFSSQNAQRLATSAGVEGVAETVAEEGEAEHHHRYGAAGASTR